MEEIRVLEEEVIGELTEDQAERAFGEAEAAEVSMRDSIPPEARKELDRELGHSRDFVIENFVPVTARQKAVQKCFEKVVADWVEGPQEKVMRPEEVDRKSVV